MKSQIRIILTCLGMAIAVGFLLLREPKFVSEEVGGDDKLVFPALIAKEVHTVQLTNRFGVLTIERQGDAWFIKEKENYQADTVYMNQVVSALSELRIIQNTTVEVAKWEQLGVQDPNSGSETGTGCRIDLYGPDNYHEGIIAGSLQASGSEAARMFGDDFDGRSFVRKIDSNHVYLVEQSLSFFNTIPSNWMLNILSNPHAYKHISYFKEGKRAWQMNRKDRSEPYKLHKESTKPGSPLSNISLSVDYAFSSMFIRDVLPKGFEPNSVSINYDHYFELEGLNDFKFRIYLGGKTPIPEQEKAENAGTTGVLRKVKSSAYRYAILDWDTPRVTPSPKEPPYPGKVYLIDCSQMENLMITYDEMLVFERISPPSGN